jgi:hypothetical protein
MLDRESKLLDVKEVWLTQSTIDGQAQSTSSKSRVESSAQAPEGVSVVALDVELLLQLGLHRFYYLPDTVEAASYLRELLQEEVASSG